MIDCSPTEIFAIKETFSDAGLYLCNFHWNHCWGHWLRTGSNSFAEHYKLIMTILMRMVEGNNLQGYKTHKAYLKSCNVYKNNMKLWEYYKRWESKKEVYCYILGDII